MRRCRHFALLSLFWVMCGGFAWAQAQEASGQTGPLQFSQEVTQELVLAYLAALDKAELDLSLTAKDDSGREKIKLGFLKVPNGTRLALKVAYARAEEGRPAVLNRLEVRPFDSGGEPTHIDLGPLQIHGMAMAPDGLLCLEAELKILSWGKDLKVCASIRRDEANNLVFMAGTVKHPRRFRFRITPDGRFEAYTGLNLIFWEFFRKWKEIKLPEPLPPIPIHEWPPSITDALAFLPASGKIGSQAEPSGLAGPVGDLLDKIPDQLRTKLEAIPVQRLDMTLLVESKDDTLKALGDRLSLTLPDHRVELKVAGGFRERAFASFSEQSRLAFRIEAQGRYEDPSLASAALGLGGCLEEARLDIRLPFENLDDLRVVADFPLRGNVPAGDRFCSNADSNAPLSGFLNLGETRATASGITVKVPGKLGGRFQLGGRFELTPLLAQSAGNLKLTIFPESRFEVEAEGPLSLEGVSGLESLPKALRLPATLTLEPFEGQPLLNIAGEMGTRVGLGGTSPLIWAEPRFQIRSRIGEGANLQTQADAPSANPSVSFATRIEPGARLQVSGRSTLGLPQDLSGLGLNLQIQEAGFSSAFSATRLRAGWGGAQLELDDPGQETFTTRIETQIRVRPSESAPQVRQASLFLQYRMGSGQGLFRAKLPGQGRVEGRIKPESLFEVETGRLTHPAGSPILQTDQARAGGKLDLQLGQDSLEDLLSGIAHLELNSWLDFRFDPQKLTLENPLAIFPGQIGIKLNSRLELEAGTRIRPSALQSGAESEGLSLLAFPIQLGSPLVIEAQSEGHLNPETLETDLLNPDSVEIRTSTPIAIKAKRNQPQE